MKEAKSASADASCTVEIIENVFMWVHGGPPIQASSQPHASDWKGETPGRERMMQYDAMFRPAPATAIFTAELQSRGTERGRCVPSSLIFFAARLSIVVFRSGPNTGERNIG